MKKLFEVTVNGKTKSFEEGTTYQEIASYYQKDYEYEILGVKVNEDFVDLGSTLSKDSNVEFFTIADEYGNKVYSRSGRFILLLAAQKAFGKKVRVKIKYSFDYVVYFTIDGIDVNDETEKLINKEFQKIVDSDFLFTHLTVSRLEAMNYFHKRKMYDKEKLLKYISNTYINLYRIDYLYDYFYGKMAYSTKQINMFKIKKAVDGFVLMFPSVFIPNELPKFKNNFKMYDKYKIAIDFGRSINISNVSDLNLKVSNAEVRDIVLMCEAHYDNQLLKIADDIVDKNKKIILLAGPSSSGKTTTAKKLSIYLKSKGYNTISISVDDYFTDLKLRPKDENGKHDFESINAVDVNLFNENLNQLLKGESVNLPQYDFVEGKRFFNKRTTKLGKNDIIVVEGLHAINDLLTKNIEKRYKYKVFLNPLASINIDDHNHINSVDIRKLRRIIRDSKTRGMSARKTLELWKDIQKGEINNIYPYQFDVDALVDSGLVYEIGVLKTYVEPLLYSVDSSALEYPEAIRLINLLRNFLPITSDDVPMDSVLREFIGGSCFK